MRAVSFHIFWVSILRLTACSRGCAEFDTDYCCKDLRTIRNVEFWHECQEYCKNDVQCKYWTYDGRGDRLSNVIRCYLKSSDNGKRRLKGVISGPKTCKDDVIASGGVIRKKTVNQDEVSTQISCSLEKSSMHTIWFFNDRQVLFDYVRGRKDCKELSGAFYHRQRLAVLVICNMDFAIHQGNYTCRKYLQGHLVSSVTSKLTIEAKPVLKIIPSGAIFIPYKEWKTVECTATGNPTPRITWYQVIKSEGSGTGRPIKFHVKKINITWSATGAAFYLCSAQNKAGYAQSALLNITVGSAIEKQDKPPITRLYTGLIILSCSLGVGLFASLAGAFWKFKRKVKIPFAPQLAPNEDFQFDTSRSIQDQITEIPYDISWEFPRADIIFVKRIGVGCFGQVWEAMSEGMEAFNPEDKSHLSLKSKLSNLHYRNPGKDHLFKKFRQHFYPERHSNQKRVAIKCLREGYTEREYNDMACELKLMIFIGRHKNIVNILGSCTINGPLWLILECCSHGDLCNFLRSRKELLPIWVPDEDISSRETLCYLDLITLARDICAGMVFLSSKNIVHRDLASRNILLDDQFTAKIADFGKARNVEAEGEYQTDSDVLVPFKWMSLESLIVGNYTILSDVWSLGVVLWEMFSSGSTPYVGVMNKDLVRYLRDGNRLSPPHQCPQNVYDIMLKCWDMKPDERPSFSMISDMLMEVMRKAFAPNENYYSGTSSLENDEAQVDFDLVDGTTILRKQRVTRQRRIGFPAIEERVEESLKDIIVLRLVQSESRITEQDP